ETLALHLRIDILDIVGDVLLLFLKALDTLDEGAQLACGNGLGGFVYNVVHSLLQLRFFSRTLAAKWLMVRCRRERRKSSRDKMTRFFLPVSGRQAGSFRRRLVARRMLRADTARAIHHRACRR